jgi:hypothetical protein
MDSVYSGFLCTSFEQAKQLEVDSDIFKILDHQGDPPSRFLLQFEGIEYLNQNLETSAVAVVKQPLLVDVHFPRDYLRSTDPQLYLKMVTLLHPEFFHPNVSLPFGYICLGHDFLPGTVLSDLAFHIHEIITYQNMTVDERDAFNPSACRYLRQYPEVLDNLRRPPLRRRRLVLDGKVEDIRDS